MKKLQRSVLLCIIGYLFVSCTTIEPRTADSSYLKGWIFRNCIDYSYKESLKEEFIGDVIMGNIPIPDFEDYSGMDAESPRSLSEACLMFFDDAISGFSFPLGNRQKAKRDLFDSYDWKIITLEKQADRWYYSGNDEKRRRDELLQQSSPLIRRQILSDLIDEFFTYIEDVAEQEVSMLNWEFNEDAMADKYTGYLVEYEIGTGYYVLLNLTEFDDADRSSWEIIYRGNSLTELQDCYE